MKFKIPKFESIGELLGFINIEITRQKGYLWWLMPILVGGLYGDNTRDLVVKIVKGYWYYAIPVWVLFILFDLFVLIPGEQNFYHKRSKVLNQILKNGKQ